MGWFSPVRRGVLPLDGLVVSRSLRRSARGFEIRVDTAFEEVIDACGDRKRPDGWITREIRAAYVALHELGWVHSVEAWREGRLAGGLYGVAVGGVFAGESMFHHERDASKVALMGLVDLLRDDHADRRVLDVQWRTPHLATLGVVEIHACGVPREAPRCAGGAATRGLRRRGPVRQGGPMKKHRFPGLLTASLVLVGASAVGCGGGGAPTDASEDDFCKELLGLSTRLGTLADASQEEAIDSIKAWAKDLEKVGTPESMSDEARDGFELMVKEVAALDVDATTEDFQNLDEGLSEAEKEASAAFETYSTDTCGAMELDTPELPEIPTPS